MTEVKPSDETSAKLTDHTISAARAIIGAQLNDLGPSLRTDVNKVIHDNPELGYEEFIAHETLSSYLEERGFIVTRKAYGIDTSFEAEVGRGGRLVVFCAEYDALPGIGHACGHNLVATSSLAAFLGAARALVDLKIAGRVRILGTPAEEGGGGKVKLIEAGAFSPAEGIAGAFMIHPMSKESLGLGDFSGLAGWTLIASQKLRVEFNGKTAHAAGDPWNGRNALDAAVAAYNNVALLRQQIEPNERIHGVFEDGGTVPNVIPEYTRMNWCIRSSTMKRSNELLHRVKKCFEAGAEAAGCSINYIPSLTYMDLRVNDTLSEMYVKEMAALGEKFLPREVQAKAFGSTDMGNVSYVVPSFHGAFTIPVSSGVACHNLDFATAAATDEAHSIAIKCAKGLAMLAIRVLVEDKVAVAARRDFENN
ncbi:M20 Peptidase Aminoacylase 1-like protein 2-like amidohydrolase subfamily protein [Aspergillus parasiticus SU-1]|uniref:Peptidase M20 domain-containing protein 2 n=1 Tax=Aspergillus parasiticus (strain ATCC 56775 / NRRL 5862 / SRRC 143 / SU-1) TaxID=1403190 RepID=A0A0F0I8G0_ASPPU|nr:M20 Peptidase Aminoacylase 1-like protein 2-like amidohydrolase subfamily protein [Aspergillus parasiticus SU-1]